MQSNPLSVRNQIGPRIVTGGLPPDATIPGWQLVRHAARAALIAIRRLMRRQNAPAPFQPLSTVTLRDIGLRRIDTSNLRGNERRSVIRPRSLWG